MQLHVLGLEGNVPRTWGEVHGESYRREIGELYEIRLHPAQQPSSARCRGTRSSAPWDRSGTDRRRNSSGQRPNNNSPSRRKRIAKTGSATPSNRFTIK